VKVRPSADSIGCLPLPYLWVCAAMWPVPVGIRNHGQGHGAAPPGPEEQPQRIFLKSVRTVTSTPARLNPISSPKR
jgi:hypothetical protein